MLDKKKLIIIAVVVIIVAGFWLLFVRRDPANQAIRQMADGTVTIKTEAEDLVQLDVKLAGSTEARARAFKGVDPKVVEKNILYMDYPFDATVAHRTEDIETTIDIAFFDAEGYLMVIFTAKPGEPEGYRPRDPYQYVLMAPAGLFQEKGIDEESRLRIVTD